ncbi:hypothetical protein BSG1_05100 [Bacillus sp. SG-1]|nr:hypothetical protein BSG1_05100 [Bacillus sp. SG-1]
MPSRRIKNKDEKDFLWNKLKTLLKGMFMLFLIISAIIFLISGYYFILTLIEAVQDVGSPKLAAFLFTIWASSAIIVAGNIIK